MKSGHTKSIREREKERHHLQATKTSANEWEKKCNDSNSLHLLLLLFHSLWNIILSSLNIFYHLLLDWMFLSQDFLRCMRERGWLIKLTVRLFVHMLFVGLPSGSSCCLRRYLLLLLLNSLPQELTSFSHEYNRSGLGRGLGLGLEMKRIDQVWLVSRL